MNKVGYLFPGQGAQFVGMGKDLYDDFTEAKQVFEQANEILGYSISEICFQGPEDNLTKTKYAQPAIFVVSIAALRVLNSKYPELNPSFSAGLSLGEFTALVAAASISFEDGLKLVQKRAEAMELSAANHPGTMASIMGLNQSECEEIAKEAQCEVANLNAPDQIVLSGTQDAVMKACQLAEQGGAKRAIPLKVGGAFHSSLMKDAKEALESALVSTDISEPSCVFVPNAKAQPVSSPSEIRLLLASQLMSSVRWVETMDVALSQSLDTIIEVGPGKVLKGLARRCHKELKVELCGTSDDIKKLETIFLQC